MNQRLKRPLLLMGCGKMGGAMLEGWLKSGIAAAGVTIVDPYQNEDFAKHPDVTYYDTAETVPADLNPEVILLAVKPQQMDDALAAYKKFAKPDTVFISVAAGKTIAYFESHLGAEAAVIRAMPNTPAAIGQGITVCCPNKNVSSAQSEMGITLLQAVGEAYNVDDESLIDPVTALSGGGPAYVFWMIETMTEAGIKAGLPEDLSARLSLMTVAGAGQLALSTAGEIEPSQLRINVTSPGGTTAEALAVLMNEENGLQPIMTQAIQAATDRSIELAK
ncbi:pyrroline-5-carboxylate reductase [Curvivirga sp.]|uniref:pyrroline-5-carboxylate reductase n=1 Tax=Curvivirga sp. TaxID=2856848 RepID=UPI003B5BC636